MQTSLLYNPPKPNVEKFVPLPEVPPHRPPTRYPHPGSLKGISNTTSQILNEIGIFLHLEKFHDCSITGSAIGTKKGSSQCGFTGTPTGAIDTQHRQVERATWPTKSPLKTGPKTRIHRPKLCPKLWVDSSGNKARGLVHKPINALSRQVNCNDY